MSKAKLLVEIHITLWKGRRTPRECIIHRVIGKHRHQTASVLSIQRLSFHWSFHSIRKSVHTQGSNWSNGLFSKNLLESRFTELLSPRLANADCCSAPRRYNCRKKARALDLYAKNGFSRSVGSIIGIEGNSEVCGYVRFTSYRHKCDLVVVGKMWEDDEVRERYLLSLKVFEDLWIVSNKLRICLQNLELES